MISSLGTGISRNEFHESSRLSPFRAYHIYICMHVYVYAYVYVYTYMYMYVEICEHIFRKSKRSLNGRARVLSRRMTYYVYCMLWFTAAISTPSIAVTLKWVRWRFKSPAPELRIVCSTTCSGADQRKHQSSASLAFVRGIPWWAVNSPLGLRKY